MFGFGMTASGIGGARCDCAAGEKNFPAPPGALRIGCFRPIWVLATHQGPNLKGVFETNMAQFRAFSGGVQVNGQTVLSLVKGMGAFAKTGTDILAQHGIKAPEPMGWYPQQAWLDAFQEISKSIGSRTLKQIGQSIPNSAKFPPGIDSVEKALTSIDVAYHMNHRGGEIGRYKFTKTGGTKGVMECHNPYPCDFDCGIIEAVVRRFMPAGAKPSVVHDASKPCRAKQGDACTYSISW